MTALVRVQYVTHFLNTCKMILHRSNFDRIIKADSIDGDTACKRLVERHFVIADMDDKSEKNLQLVKAMIMIGLKGFLLRRR